MDMKDLGFGIFYVIAVAAIVALGALGLYTLEAWRHPTSDHEANAAH